MKRSKEIDDAQKPTKKQRIDTSIQLTDDESRKHKKLMSIDPQYICPITRVLLSDPVYIVSSEAEHVMYEAKALREWLKHETRDPFTGKRLSDSARVAVNKYFLKALEEYKETSVRKILTFSAKLNREAKHEYAASLLKHALDLIGSGSTSSKKKQWEDVLYEFINCCTYIDDETVLHEMIHVAKRKGAKSPQLTMCLKQLLTSDIQTNILSKRQLISLALNNYETFVGLLPEEEMRSLLSTWVRDLSLFPIKDSLCSVIAGYEHADVPLLLSGLSEVNSLKIATKILLRLQKLEIPLTELKNMDEIFMELVMKQFKERVSPIEIIELGLQYYAWRDGIQNIKEHCFEFGEEFLRELLSLDPNHLKTNNLYNNLLTSDSIPIQILKSLNARMSDMQQKQKEMDLKLRILSFKAPQFMHIINSSLSEYWLCKIDQKALETRKVKVPFRLCGMIWGLTFLLDETRDSGSSVSICFKCKEKSVRPYSRFTISLEDEEASVTELFGGGVAFTMHNKWKTSKFIELLKQNDFNVRIQIDILGIEQEESTDDVNVTIPEFEIDERSTRSRRHSVHHEEDEGIFFDEENEEDEDDE